MEFSELCGFGQRYSALQRLLQSLRLIFGSKNVYGTLVIRISINILRGIGSFDLEHIL